MTHNNHVLIAGVEGAVIVGKVMDMSEHNMGYDAASGTFTDMVKAGIIDPLKVSDQPTWKCRGQLHQFL